MDKTVSEDTVRAALPELEKTGGRVVLIGSVAGFVSAPKNGAYNASKAAIRAIGAMLGDTRRTLDYASRLDYYRSRLFSNSGRYTTNILDFSKAIIANLPAAKPYTYVEPGVSSTPLYRSSRRATTAIVSTPTPTRKCRAARMCAGSRRSTSST